jgi:hypothetical protein
MPIDKDLVLDYLGSREDDGRERLLHQAAYYLMRLIFRKKRFGSVEQLLEFCEEPENLHPWLPNETDRILLSGELRDSLQNLVTDLGLTACVADEEPDLSTGRGKERLLRFAGLNEPSVGYGWRVTNAADKGGTAVRRVGTA